MLLFAARSSSHPVPVHAKLLTFHRALVQAVENVINKIVT